MSLLLSSGEYQLPLSCNSSTSSSSSQYLSNNRDRSPRICCARYISHALSSSRSTPNGNIDPNGRHCAKTIKESTKGRNDIKNNESSKQKCFKGNTGSVVSSNPALNKRQKVTVISENLLKALPLRNKPLNNKRQTNKRKKLVKLPQY